MNTDRDPDLTHRLARLAIVLSAASTRANGGSDPQLATLLRRAADEANAMTASCKREDALRRERGRALERLTGRERQILSLMADGYSNRRITEQLRVSMKTLDCHAAAIFRKLGLPPGEEHNRRVRAVLLWREAAPAVTAPAALVPLGA